MGARSGSSSGSGSGGLGKGDIAFTGDIKNVESLKNIQDRIVYNETKAAISRYYKEMGLTQKNVKLADLPAGVGGVHVTTLEGKSEGVYLSKSMFKNATKQQIEKQVKSGYEKGWTTKTNKAIAHVATHELAHSTWNAHMKGAKYAAAGKEISRLYKAWKADTRKTGYGKYASTNVSEFYAETVTKAIHGKADKYTKAVKAISKKYNL